MDTVPMHAPAPHADHVKQHQGNAKEYHSPAVPSSNNIMVTAFPCGSSTTRESSQGKSEATPLTSRSRSCSVVFLETIPTVCPRCSFSPSSAPASSHLSSAFPDSVTIHIAAPFSHHKLCCAGSLLAAGAPVWKDAPFAMDPAPGALPRRQPLGEPAIHCPYADM